MGSVKTGISLIYWGLVAIIIAVILLVVVVTGAFGDASGYVAIAALIAMLVGYLLGIIGKVTCLGAPQETGAREFIMIAVFFEGVSMLISVLDLLRQIGAVSPTILPEWAPRVGQLLGMVGFVLFMLFLKQLAIFIQRDDLAQAAASVLTLGVIMIVCAFLTGLAVFIAPILALIIALVMLVVSILFLVRYVGLIAKMKDAI